MSKKSRSGNPQKRAQEALERKLLKMGRDYTEDLKKATTYEEVAKISIKVNREIDRISNHLYKSAGEFGANGYEWLASEIKKVFSLEAFKEVTLHEADVLVHLNRIPVGGTVTVINGKETVTYTKIA